MSEINKLGATIQFNASQSGVKAVEVTFEALFPEYFWSFLYTIFLLFKQSSSDEDDDEDGDEEMAEHHEKKDKNNAIDDADAEAMETVEEGWTYVSKQGKHITKQ